MDSTLQVTVVSSNSLVTSNSNRDSIVEGGHFSLNLGDSSNSKPIAVSKSVAISKSGISKSGISQTKTSITIGTVQESWVGLALALAATANKREIRTFIV